MKLLVIGGSGGTGSAILGCALRAGHAVTAFARNPAAISLVHERLQVVQGDVLRFETLAAAVQGHDAILSALGPARGTKPGTLISDGTRNMILAMGQHGIRRLVFESGLMVGDGRGMNAIKRVMLGAFRALHRDLYRDKVKAERLVVESALDWTIVRPPKLTRAPARGNYRVGESLDVDLLAGLAHADVADFMVSALSDSGQVRRIVDISY